MLWGETTDSASRWQGSLLGRWLNRRLFALFRGLSGRVSGFIDENYDVVPGSCAGYALSRMITPAFRLFVLGIFVTAMTIFSVTAEAALVPGLLTRDQGLWYRQANGDLSELLPIDAQRAAHLRALARPITLVELRQIPIGTLAVPLLERDADGDGLDDEYERAFETDPRRADSDQDGFDDQAEILSGYNPLKKRVKLAFNQTVYKRYKGQFVWESVRRQLWYVLADKPVRVFVTTRPVFAWQYLRQIAPITGESIGCRFARPGCASGLVCSERNACIPADAPDPTTMVSIVLPAPVTPAPVPSLDPAPPLPTVPPPPTSPSPSVPVAEPAPPCLPERCTQMDWRDRSRLLTIPDYQRSVESDGRLALKSGKFTVVLPDDRPDAEAYGRIQLYQLLQAYRNTEALLGIAPVSLPNVIRMEFVLDHDNTGSCCGPVEQGHPIIWNLGTRDQYLQKIALEDPNTQYYKRKAWDDTIGDHELTHRFIHTLDVSGFLNEGLANYAQDRGREPAPFQCEQGGYRLGDGTFHPYRVYSCRPGDTSIYYSGDCFWQRIESRYGVETLRGIIARFADKPARQRALVYYPRNDGTPYSRAVSYTGQVFVDLEQAVAPVVGERFWSDFADFGISRTMAEGKTYISDVAACR